MPPDTRDAVIDFVATWSAQSELPATRVVGWLGLGASKYFDWKRRYGKVNEHNATVPRDHWHALRGGGGPAARRANLYRDVVHR